MMIFFFCMLFLAVGLWLWGSIEQLHFRTSHLEDKVRDINNRPRLNKTSFDEEFHVLEADIESLRALIDNTPPAKVKKTSKSRGKKK